MLELRGVYCRNETGSVGSGFARGAAQFKKGREVSLPSLGEPAGRREPEYACAPLGTERWSAHHTRRAGVAEGGGPRRKAREWWGCTGQGQIGAMVSCGGRQTACLFVLLVDEIDLDVRDSVA